MRKPLKGCWYFWDSGKYEYLVKCTGDLGLGSDGRRYIKVEGSTAGVPFDQCRIAPQPKHKE